MSKKISRREFLRVSAVTTAGAFLAACGGQGATSTPTTEAAQPTEPPAMEATATTAAPSVELKEIPRNQTHNLAWSISSPIGVTNPWVSTGYTHQEANALLWEPLQFYAIYASKEMPWLAESMEYNSDFTQLTVNVRKDAYWSDGEQVTSKDVKYVFDGNLSIDTLQYHASFDQFVQDVTATDDFTVVVNFKLPAPRFKFEVLTTKFDTGIDMLPEHVLSQQADVTTFEGGNDIAHSGPYNLLVWDQNQKILDLRDDWWAVSAGLMETPDVKRVVMTNIGGQVGQNMDVVAQKVVNNEYDATLDMRSAVIGNILKQNPNVTTHTGNNPPYGYLDWWPNSLWCNTQLAPYDNPDVRKAISLSIDRDKIDEIIYEGAKVSTIYPFPLYPNLVKFTQLPEVQALVEKYQPRKFDLDESATLMEGAGFTKNSNGLWEKDGSTVNATVMGFEGIHSDIVPVLVEMLIAGGFDAAVDFGTEAYNQMAAGEPGLYMFGHGASLIDPYATFELFHGRYSAALGSTAGSNRFSRYKNPEFDAILDEIAPLGSDDPKFTEGCVKAMEIYWRDTIDIPVIQWLHRIPYNQTYWVNWPTEANPSIGINGAFWHHTGMLVITTLKATNA